MSISSNVAIAIALMLCVPPYKAMSTPPLSEGPIDRLHDKSISTSIRSYLNVPYALISPQKPSMTIIYIRGGPEFPALGAPNAFDKYLVRKFNARIIKPAYYGTSERSPWSKTPDLDLSKPVSKAVAANQVLRAIEATYRGMPQAVAEIRSFIKRWDAITTTVIGESHGSTLVALAGDVARKSRVVLIAPVIASRRSIVEATEDGRYHALRPVDPPHIVIDDRDVTAELFDTNASRKRLLETTSLAYYRPWDGWTLDEMLRSSSTKAMILVGLQDRIGLVSRKDWIRFRRHAPPGTIACVDPDLKHEVPTASALATSCFERFVKGRHNRTAARISRQ